MGSWNGYLSQFDADGTKACYRCKLRFDQLGFYRAGRDIVCKKCRHKYNCEVRLRKRAKDPVQLAKHATEERKRKRKVRTKERIERLRAAIKKIAALAG